MPSRHHARPCTLLALALLAVSGPARAQQAASSAPTGASGRSCDMTAASCPMPPDVSPDGRPSVLPELPPSPAEAHVPPGAPALFAEGTTLFKQWRFDQAEQRFREALAHQEHPIIHLYLSRALEKQGRLVEAHEALQPALRPHIAPLPPEDVQVTEELRQSLEARLAQLDVHCDVPGAEVALDGEPWFTAPGRQRRMIGAGQHVLVARKPGYFPVAEPVSLVPGKQTRVVLRMTADVVHFERRWQPWKPRVVAGAGLAASLAGGLLLWQATSDYAAVQAGLDACQGELSCSAISTRRFHRAEWTERIGTGVLIGGAGAVAAGLAGMLLNLPRARRSEHAGGLEDLDIVPMFSGDTAGVSARLPF